MGFRVCNSCKVSKPLSEFHRRTQRGKVGYQHRCKACKHDEAVAAYAADPDKIKRVTAQYRRDHPESKARWDKTYAARHPEDVKRHRRLKQATRRARKLNQFIERVDPQTVYDMHGGMCGICEEFINGDFHVDHVIPLSKGGMHGYINVQPAHPKCNISKSNRVI